MSFSSSAFASAAAALGILFSLDAHANERTTARLHYERAPDAADCPDEQALRRSVAERLGYDPFVENGATTVDARIARTEGGHAGTVAVTREGSTSSAPRSLSAPGDCSELVQTMALTISIALDPSSLTSPPPAPSPRPEERPAPPTTPAKNVVTLGAGPLLTFGESPAPAVGAVLFGGLRRDWFEVLLEARATLPAQTSTRLGTVSSWSAGGVAGACAHASWFFGCGTALFVATVAHGEVDRGTTTAAPSVFAGPRLGIAIPLGSGPLELRIQADALLALTRHRLALGGQQVYEYPAGMLDGAVLLGIRL